MQYRSEDGRVGQFRALAGMAKKQAAAAHVAAADELEWKPEPLAEDSRQHADVLRRRDAAKQDDVAVGPDLIQQSACARLERPSIPDVANVDVASRERPNSRSRHAGIGGAEAGIRRDDVDARPDNRIVGLWRGGESARIRELATEIQATDERKEIADRRSLRRPQLRGNCELRARRERLSGARATAIRRRKQEDTAVH